MILLSPEHSMVALEPPVTMVSLSFPLLFTAEWDLGSLLGVCCPHYLLESCKSCCSAWLLNPKHKLFPSLEESPHSSLCRSQPHPTQSTQTQPLEGACLISLFANTCRWGSPLYSHDCHHHHH